jgi:Zn-dependent protease with chaperone function
MNFSVYLALILSLLLAITGPVAARWLAPAAASGVLAAAALTSAAGSTWAMLLLAATLLDRTPVVREQAAARGIHIPVPVPGLMGAAGLAALSIALYRAVLVVRQRRAVISELRRVCLLCGGQPADQPGDIALVVAPTAEPDAIAVPGAWGRGGQILVSLGMLQALDAPGRRALLAHERSHLQHHHYWHRAAAELAAALNPLLIPIREATAFLVERRADEYAATVLGDRAATAQALAHAALAAAGEGAGPTASVALSYQRLQVSRRVAALTAAPPPERRLPGVALLLLGALTAVCALDATLSFVRLVHPLVPT